MEKVMILSTPLEIAEGLAIFLDKYRNPSQESDFKAEKMSVAEAARHIGISYASMIKWISAGHFRCHGTGRTRFLLKSELIEDYKKMSK